MRVGVWYCTPDREKSVQRLCKRKVHSAFEEIRETAEGTAREEIGASGNHGPHEASMEEGQTVQALKTGLGRWIFTGRL